MCVYRARSRDVACAYTFFENSSRFRFFCDPLSDSLHFSLSLSLSLCAFTRARKLLLITETQTDRQTEISDPKWILSLLLLLLRSRRRCHLQPPRLLRRVRRRLLRCRGCKRARISTFPIPISVTLCCVSSSLSLSLSFSLASLKLSLLFGVCECESCAPSRLSDGVFF